MINYSQNSSNPYSCSGQDCSGMPTGCSDFIIKRHDTRPAFKVNITDCDNPIDLTNLVIEASMWTNTKLKKDITNISTTIEFADNIGFDQINEGTIIQIGDNRKFERMLIQSINEDAKTITVFRGQDSTQSYNWKKGSKIRLIRFLNRPAESELEYQDITNLDGTIEENVLARSTLIYNWFAEDTCFWGKYYLEFKVMQVIVATSTTTPNPNYHCDLGAGVLWARRFPNDREGFLITILDSPTAE